METWTIHSNCLDHRRKHGANAVTIEAYPETIRMVVHHIRASYRRALRAYVERAKLQWPNLSGHQLLLMWRQSARSVVWDTAFAMHLAVDSFFTAYHDDPLIKEAAA